MELVKLARDLGEKNDLAAREPRRVAQLRAEFDIGRKAVRPKFPTANPAYDPAKPSGRAAGKNL